MLLLLAGGAFLLWHKLNADDASAKSQQFILRRGQTFATSNDYLRLFGITSTEHDWDQPLPHHEGIIV